MLKTAGLLLVVLVSPSLSAGCDGGKVVSCESGYILNPDACKCYKITNQYLNYKDATAACQTENATLPIIMNYAENSWLSGLTWESWNATDVWIGLWCLESQLTSCSWVDGTTLGYNNFEGIPFVNTPTFLETPTGKWYSYKATANESFICQKPAIFSNPLPTTPMPCTKACDWDYTLNPDACKCYKYNSAAGGTVSYQFANEYCQWDNGTLAIIRNSAENDFLSDLARNISLIPRNPKVGNPGIGLWCNTASFGSCRWVDGSPLGYSNLAGLPLYNSPVYLHEVDKMWYSESTNGFDAFICEKSAGQRK